MGGMDIAPTKALVSSMGGAPPHESTTVAGGGSGHASPMKAPVEEWVLVVALRPRRRPWTRGPHGHGLMISLVTEAMTTAGHPLTSTVATMALAMEERDPPRA